MVYISIFIVIFLCYFPSAYTSLDFRLSASKVLLPYFSTIQVNYTIEIVSELKTNNCFKWSSTSAEVATVTAENESCSHRAVITAVWKNPSRSSTAIIVENSITGHIIKCDVIVDKPMKLEIETTTQELYLHDAPEALIVRAYDDLGNKFSSLDGLPLEWIISSVQGGQSGDGLNILRFISWTESDYEIPALIGNLEAQGLHGDQQLVSGIKTGSANVGVRMKSSIYKEVQAGLVKLLVMANAILKPSIAYLVPQTSLKFAVLVFNQGVLNGIPMPSEQYYLKLNDDQKAFLDIAASMLTAIHVGEVEVTLHDKNIEENEAFKRPKSVINIVEPSYLTFTALPGRRWALDISRVYTIIIDIYDHNSHKIWPSDQLRIKADFPGNYFKVLESSINGTWHRVSLLSQGVAKITAKLDNVVTLDGTTHALAVPVYGAQEAEIFNPVTIHPNRLALPWSANSAVNKSTCQFKAIGGSGDYAWTSSNSSLIAISNRGLVLSVNQGAANVSVSDIKNPDNVDISSVFVVEPAELQFLPREVEAELSHEIIIPFVLLGDVVLLSGVKTRLAMCSCSHLPFEFSFAEIGIFEISSFPNSTDFRQSCTKCSTEGCAQIRVRALRKGFTKLVARYVSSDGLYPMTIQEEIMLGAFKSLKPSLDRAIVTLGSLQRISFQGGPQPWILDPSSYKAILSPSQDDLVNIKQVLNEMSSSFFDVRCEKLGSQEVILSTTNSPTSKNKYPVVRSVSIWFICAVPTSMRLIPQLNLPTLSLPPCPITEDPTTVIPIHNYRSLVTNILFFDENGHQFTNTQSLVVAALSSDPVVANIHLFSDPSLFVNIQPNKQNNTFVLSVSTKGYNKDYTKFIKDKSQAKLVLDISSALTFRTVHDARAQPSELLVYKNKIRDSWSYIGDGSGHFHITNADKSVLTASLKGRFVELKSVVEEENRLVIYDLCLEQPRPLDLQVFVVSLHRIKLFAEDKLILGGSQTATVQFFGKHSRLLPRELFTDLSLGYRSVPADIVSVGIDGAVTLKGLALGRTRLQVYCHNTQVESNWLDILVFPPLQLRPPNSTLLVGSVIQLQTVGGPPSSTISFQLYNTLKSSVIKLSEGGLLDALNLGQVDVKAEAVGTNSKGESVVYSSAIGIVKVVQLKDLRIHAPVTVIKDGNCVPLWAVAKDGVNPIALSTVTPPIYFHWSLDAEGHIGRLRHLLSPIGVQLQAKRMAAGIRFCALAPGQATIYLKVSRGDWKNSMEAQITIQIRKGLEVTGLCAQCILMAPDSVYQVPISDKSSAVKYKVSHIDHSETMRDYRAKPVVDVTSNGLLVAGSNYGNILLTMSDSDKTGYNQTLTTRVEVASVAYVMINYEAPDLPPLRSEMLALPLGGVYQFQISAHNIMGDKFHVANIPLDILASQLHFVQFSPVLNQSFTARSSVPGYTALQAYHNGFEDFGVIFSGSVVNPHDISVPLGSIICFSSPYVPAAVTWSSSNPDNLDVHRFSGFGVAKLPGVAIVTLHTLVFSAATHIEVKAVESLQLEFPSGSVLSDYQKSSPVYVTLKLPDDSLSVVYGQNCSAYDGDLAVTCQIFLGGSFSNDRNLPNAGSIFTVQSVLKNNRFACRISPRSIAKLDSLMTSSEQIFVTLVATLSDSVSAETNIPFLPAFHLVSDDILTLTEEMGEIRVIAHSSTAADILVTSSRSDVLEVMATRQTSLNVVVIPCRLLTREESVSDLHVSIQHRITKQIIDVPVKIDIKFYSQRDLSAPSKGSFLDESWHSLLLVGIGCFIALFVVLFTIKFCQPNSYYQQGVVSGSPGPIRSPGLDESYCSSQPMSQGRPMMWSQGYSFTATPDFHPVSVYKRSPASPVSYNSFSH